jgi:hypothetical protein
MKDKIDIIASVIFGLAVLTFCAALALVILESIK